jgi:hypothetical protein
MSECPHYNSYNNWCEKSNKEIDWAFAKNNCFDNYLKCPTFADDKYQGEGSGSGDGCYLTMAMCEVLNKPDDCFELSTMRKFRDNYLLKNKNTKGLVQEYYKNSPALAIKLKESPEKVNIAKIMIEKYINPIIDMVEKKDYSPAIETYKNMYNFLSDLLGGK